MRALLIEVHCGELHLEYLNPSDQFPLAAPFKQPMSEEEYLKMEETSKEKGSSVHFSTTAKGAIFTGDGQGHMGLFNYFKSRQSSGKVMLSDLRRDYQRE